jgi:hypothetical protein
VNVTADPSRARRRGERRGLGDPRQSVAIADGAVPDERRRPFAALGGVREHRVRRADHRRVRHAHPLEGRGIHLSAPCVDPDAHVRRIRERGERLEARHADERLLPGQGEALHRGDSDPQAGERSGAGRDGEHIDARERYGVAFEERDEIRRHACGDGLRGIECGNLDRARLVGQGRAPGRRRRVERQDDHGEMDDNNVFP